MSRCRLNPTPEQEILLLEQRGQARYVWNLALEQRRLLRLQRRLARLEHKAPSRVEHVPAPYSSQRCNRCGHVDPNSRQSQAEFECTSCGFRCNADHNAAMNIADANPAVGRTVAARGDRVKSARSAKREPQRNRPPKVA